MNIDGKRLTENQRMTLLRAEEHEALGMWEIPSNALISARLSLHPQTIASLPGEADARPVATPNTHHTAGQMEDMDGTLLGAMA
jgi:hypothetical protein